jgi:hypothetical protein
LNDRDGKYISTNQSTRNKNSLQLGQTRNDAGLDAALVVTALDLFSEKTNVRTHIS